MVARATCAQARGFVAQAHKGKSECGVTWCGRRAQILSTGVADKAAGREWALFGVAGDGALSELARGELDSGTSRVEPHYDADTNLAICAGSGDASIGFFEVTDEAPFVHLVAVYRSNVGQVKRREK